MNWIRAIIQYKTVILALVLSVPYTPFVNGESQMQTSPSLSTETMLSSCTALFENKKPLTYADGLCMGIIYGVEDNANYDKKICIPIAVDQLERINVVRLYVLGQPKRSTEAFASLVFDALHQKWPCVVK
uniref:Rap1a/Tai family immunity protein n=1 Tax=Polynucleobacter sp. TaxID=2029855 RepID=UPI004048B5A5